MSNTTEQLPLVKSMTVPQLRAELVERGLDPMQGKSKKDVAAAVEAARAKQEESPVVAPQEPGETDDVIDGDAVEEPTPEELDRLEDDHRPTDVAVRESGVPRQSFNDRERELIARLVAPGHTADELALFEAICVRTGLDPFARQIYSIKRNRRRQVNGNWITEEVATPQTSIDGFRLIAHRTAQYQGQTPPEWYDDERNEWVSVWLKDTNPPAARVGVYRNGFATPLIRTVTWREFGGTTATWKSMPALMLAKCAESQALRAAFPQELSGLYTEEEMAQAQSGEPEHSYSAALEPVRQDAPQTPVPRSAAEVHARLSALLGADETTEWLREAVVEYAATKDVEVASFSELSQAMKNDVGQRLCGVVIDLEERESETGEDLRMSTGVRDKVRAVFAKRFDGLPLDGPSWSLGPDEEQTQDDGNAEDIPFGDDPPGQSPVSDAP